MNSQLHQILQKQFSNSQIYFFSPWKKHNLCSFKVTLSELKFLKDGIWHWQHKSALDFLNFYIFMYFFSFFTWWQGAGVSSHSQFTVVPAALSNFGFTRINPATIYFKGIKLEFGVLHLKTSSRLIHSQFTCAPGPNAQNEKWTGRN